MLIIVGAGLMTGGFIVIGPFPGINVAAPQVYIGLVMIGIAAALQILPGLFQVKR